MLSMRAMGITAFMSLLLAGSASAETGAIDTCLLYTSDAADE